MREKAAFAVLFAGLLCACGGSIGSDSSSDAGEPEAAAAAGPCVFPSGNYEMTWVADRAVDCPSGTGVYLFQWAACGAAPCTWSAAGSQGQLTTAWPPNTLTPQQDNLFVLSDGTCRLTGRAPFALPDGGAPGSLTDYALTPDGFAGTTTIVEGDGGSTCGLRFTAKSR